MSQPRVSVVVVNYNGRHLLAPCLDSLLALDYPAEQLQLLLVDNASGDGSADFVREQYGQRVTVLASAANEGYAGGANAGIRAADGEYVAILNNDVRLDPDWLNALLAPAQADDRVAVVGSRILFDAEPLLLNSAGMLVDRYGGVADRGYRQPEAGLFAATEEVFAVCGASMLLRQEAIKEIGQFDARFFLYYEDIELCWRARLAGWKVVYAAGSLVYHRHAATTGEWSPLFRFYVARNRLLMLLKLAPPGPVLRGLAGQAWETLRALLNCMLPVSARQAPGQAPEPPMARLTRALSVWLHLLRFLPSTLRERRRWRRQPRDGDLQRWWAAK